MPFAHLGANENFHKLVLRTIDKIRFITKDLLKKFDNCNK